MQRKNKWLIPPTFLKSLFFSLSGLIFYIIGKKAIPFPEKWMGASKNHSLFFLGIFNHLTVSWLLNYIFIFFNEDKYGGEKIQRWKNRLNKILVFIFFIGGGLINYWSSVENSLSKIALLTLILAIINCLIDSLIQWMNKNGVCNGFSLLLFSEFLPTRWISATLWPNIKNGWRTGNWTSNGGNLVKEPWFCLILLLLISILFTWFVNVKWEVPIETNTIHFSDNSLIQKYKSKLSFRTNFSSMPLYQLSQLLSWIFIGIKLISIPSQVEGSNWLVRLSKRIGLINNDLAQKSTVWKGGEEKIGEKLFLLNNKKRLFGDLGQWISEKKWAIFLALFLLIMLRWLVVWFSVRKFNLKTGEISDKLKKRGVYINHLAPGRPTRELLKKIINRLVFYWIFLTLIFNIIFDQIFTNMEKDKVKMIEKNIMPPSAQGLFFVSFLDWFGSVGVGIDLYRQIITKYKYSKN
jgi:preprotein translocase subunit SecY